MQELNNSFVKYLPVIRQVGLYNDIADPNNITKGLDFREEIIFSDSISDISSILYDFTL